MKTKFYNKVLFSLIIMGLLIVGMPFVAHGEDVQTNGEIVIEKDETVQTTDTTTSSTIDPPKVKKPVGRLPSTGDLIKTSLSISGIALLLIIFANYLWKHKKKADQKGGG
ncbi:hypothetical protein IGJ55_000302 [Enterococcus sp. AZ170]|uniref:LPXTG cell wall anchor domain-containing protein n=1 Tax=Enterococcus sp. AZ170 TaxID=2774747 RepID=UPI003D2FC8EE